LGFAEPLSVAELLVNVAGEVTTLGGSGVVNETTDPNAVPTELEAIAQT
jgi:hypothetical protein